MDHTKQEPGFEGWNTGILYTSPDSPLLERDLEIAAETVQDFRRSFSGKVALLDPLALLRALTAFESLQELVLKPQFFAQLLFAADSENDAIKALSQKASEFGNLMVRELLFFDLELLEIEDEQFAALVSNDLLANYVHYLESVRKFRGHTLSEREEQLLKQKNISGSEAFSRLFDELSSSFTYKMDIDGEERTVTGEELLALLHHPDAVTRERGFSLFLDRHADESIVFSSIFNNIILDYREELQLRHYSSPMEPTNIANELPSEIVERLMTVTEKNYCLAREYFILKTKIMGLTRLKNSDIYAPLQFATRRYTFDEARELVTDAYCGFNPSYRQMIDAFFTQGRIEIHPRRGKSGGAFCMGMTPSLPPYVLLNFTGNLRDVSTLAHELGHGLHFIMAQKQTMLNYHPPLPLAETASVFGEMLLTRLLLERESDPDIRKAFLCATIEDCIATTLRQVVLTRFEENLHLERRKGLVSSSRICDLWWEENLKLYGEAVEMIPSYRWGWSYISHFIHTRFYCYSYTFAQLLVLSLFQNYLIQGADFVPVYEQILSSGGALSPAATVRPAGIDLADQGFWQQGYDYLGTLIANLRELVEIG